MNLLLDVNRGKKHRGMGKPLQGENCQHTHREETVTPIREEIQKGDFSAHSQLSITFSGTDSYCEDNNNEPIISRSQEREHTVHSLFSLTFFSCFHLAF